MKRPLCNIDGQYGFVMAGQRLSADDELNQSSGGPLNDTWVYSIGMWYNICPTFTFLPEVKVEVCLSLPANLGRGGPA